MPSEGPARGDQGAPGAPGRARGDEPQPGSSPPRILVIDDSPEVAALVRAELELEGYEVTVAPNGLAGLSVAATNRPDLILLDVNMPGLDGYEVCRRFRQAEATRSIPLLMLTGLTGLPAKLRALEIGADDFLSKPFNGPELLGHVRSRLRVKRMFDDLTESRAQLAAEAQEAQGAIEQLEARLFELADELHVTRASAGGGELPDDLALPAPRQLMDLREGIARGELLLHYQPKVRASDGAPIGAEALVRWQHPTRGLIPPGRFVPLAEHSAIADDLARWVIDEAARQAKAWLEGGQAIAVALNVSARNLHDPQFAELVARRLDAWSFPASLVTLELTESAVMRDIGRAADTLERVRALGVSIAIDDFGTGQSSLHYLDRLPVDELKIDRSLVTRIDADERKRVIVAAITRMAHRLGLRTVAEGVETERELRTLRQVGCDAAQGFLLSRPLPAHHFISWWFSHTSSHDSPEDASNGALARGA